MCPYEVKRNLYNRQGNIIVSDSKKVEDGDNIVFGVTTDPEHPGIVNIPLLKIFRTYNSGSTDITSSGKRLVFEDAVDLKPNGFMHISRNTLTGREVVTVFYRNYRF